MNCRMVGSGSLWISTGRLVILALALCVVVCGLLCGWVHVNLRHELSFRLITPEHTTKTLMSDFFGESRKYASMVEVPFDGQPYQIALEIRRLFGRDADINNRLVRTVWREKRVFPKGIGTTQRFTEDKTGPLNRNRETGEILNIESNPQTQGKILRVVLGLPVGYIHPLLKCNLLQSGLQFDGSERSQRQQTSQDSDSAKKPAWHVCRDQQFTPWILGRFVFGLPS